jgi:predicted phosphodiesterase
MQRDLRSQIDTGWRQARELGIDSLFKPASYVPSIISGVAQFCLARRDVDAILITGDIATTGLPADLNIARNFVTARATAGGFVSDVRFPTLNGSGVPIYVLPGNHDRYADNMGTPDCAEFDGLFGAYMPNFRSSIGYWIDQKENRQVAFVYGDFCLQTRMDALDNAVAVFGQGRVYQDVLKLLEDKTRQLQTESKISCVVWAIHFAPFECGYQLCLINYQDILRSAEDLGVKAILCGHTHNSMAVAQRGHTIYCAGSAGCIDREDDARVQVFNIDIDETCSVWRENYIWSAEQHEFMFDSVD